MNDELIGVIKLFAGNFAPQGYMLCQGQTLAINEHEALYAILGNTYGGDIQNNNFQLPNLCSKFVKGTGVNASGTQTVTLGESGGTESIVPTLTYANQMPCAILDSQYLGLNYIICVEGIFPSRP
jgi:microcystin-dependent protein